MIETPQLDPHVANAAEGSLVRASNSAVGAKDGELDSLIVQFSQQIAERLWDKPPGNNALETYNRIAKQVRSDGVAARLGERFSTLVWSEANDAERAGRLDEAVHLFAILKKLPPVPAAVILGTGGYATETSDQKTTRQRIEQSAGYDNADPIPGEPVFDASNRLGVSGTTRVPAIQTAIDSEKGGRSGELGSIAMARGDEAIAHGDVITARRFYELAASIGLAQAPTAVGRTYDPTFLQEKGVRGLMADVDAAKRWYQKGSEAGDAEAGFRLGKLSSTR